LSDGSVPQGSGKHDAPQPPTVADAAFCELVAIDLGVKPSTAKTAFLGEEASHLLGVVAWALDQAPENPERRAKMIVAWAKKRRCGAFREPALEFAALVGGLEGEEAGYKENLALAKLILMYWTDNPKRLAKLIDEVEIWFNARAGAEAENGERS
jgi:hypothetical protein